MNTANSALGDYTIESVLSQTANTQTLMDEQETIDSWESPTNSLIADF